MPRQKRASEKELNKDIYDAEEDDRFAEVPDPGQGMTRASEDVIKQRKIVKVSRRKFGGGGGSGSGTSASRPSASSNPFAATTLATPAATSTSAAPSKPNPFSGIALASNSKTAANAAAAPKFTFGSAPAAAAPKPAGFTFGSAPAAAAPKPAGFTFGSGAAPSSSSTSQPAAAAAPPKSLLSTPKSPRSKRQRIQELNHNFLQMIVDHWEGRMYAADYSHFMREYQEHQETLQLSEGDEGSETVDDPPAGGTLAATNNNSQPATSWATPAPSPAPAFSFGATPAPKTTGTTFSFTSKPAGAPTAGAAAPSFAFGAAPSSSSGSVPSAGGSGNNDDPNSNPDDGKVEKIEQEENTEEDVLLEVRAKPVKLEGGKWKKYGAGVLRLYRHKTTSKCRIVVRNEIGKVQFNVGVSRGMKFEKVIKETKKGSAAYVKFMAVEDAKKGPEVFMLQSKPDSVDKLHKTLEGMAV